MTGDEQGAPYRGGAGSAPEAEAHENGIVDELIQQFADPLAFYRELVQNSIDAGASRIAITLGWDPPRTFDDAPGSARISVRDDGCGMSRDVLENQLTVLFRSGKEGQEDKIGKFGVGFVSVLALAPTQVVVRTSEGKGEQWTLVLKTDQTYELFRAQGGGSSGTSVTLEVPRRRAELDALVSGSEAALRRWCRHAELPIRFVATVPDAPMREVRVDRPFGLDALAQVRVTEGSTTVVAGVPSGGQSYLGFFNRGLLLHETSTPILGSVHVKILDANLEHTLSRDNVRRDAHYDRAMKLAKRAVERDLTAAVQRRLGELAAAPGEGSLDALLVAALEAGLALDYDALELPLASPVGGVGRARVSALGEGYVASGDGPLPRALAAQGIPVVDLSIARSEGAYLQALQHLLRRAPPRVESELTLATPVEPSSSDLALLAAVEELLADCARRPSAVRLAVLEGRRGMSLSVAGALEDAPRALTEEEASSDPFRLLLRPPLLLNASHELVAAARRVAVERPAFAGAMLARAVLVSRGRLDEGADDAWLERALTRVMR